MAVCTSSIGKGYSSTILLIGLTSKSGCRTSCRTTPIALILPISIATIIPVGNLSSEEYVNELASARTILVGETK